MDRQSDLFCGADQSTWYSAELLEHPNSTLDDLVPAELRRIEEYEADGWDAERAEPKNLDEARENLAFRIADPYTPDSEHESGAYDNLDPDTVDEFADEVQGGRGYL